MLGPSFKEGQTKHDATDPLKLPEDDPTAVLNLFHILHYHRDRVEKKRPGWLQDLAMTCNKYDCADILQDYFHVKILELSSSEPNPTLSAPDAFIIALITHNTVLFWQMSNKVIRMTKKEFESSCRVGLLELLPSGTPEHLRLVRSEIRLQHISAAQKPIADLLSSTKYGLRCQGANQRLAAYTEALLEHNLILLAPLEDTELTDLCGDLADALAKKNK